MLLKITYQDQTHLMKSRDGHSFSDLQSHASKAFKKLPKHYRLVYVDQQGDDINLDNDQDYESLISSGLTKTTIRVVEVEAHKIINHQNSSSQLIKEFESPNLEIENKVQQEEKTEENIENKIQKEQSLLQKRIQKKVEQNSKNEQQSQQNQIQNKPKKVDEQFPRQIHCDVTCDQCGIFPVIGIRYKCNVCPNYDICQECEQHVEHEHAMLKIKFYGQQYSKQEFSAVEQIGSSVMCGANKLKQGFNTAVTTLRKMSSKPEKIEKKVQVMPITHKHEVKDNAIAALDVLKDKVQPVKTQVKQTKEMTEQDILIDNSNYICLLLNVDFSRSYSFVKKHPGVSKQQLIVQYFEDVKNL